MKKNLLFAIGLGAVLVLTGCKSQESAYRKSYEQAMAQEKAQTADNTTTVSVSGNPAQETVTVTPVTPVTPSAPSSNDADVRTINEGFTVVGGAQVKAYSVVVGSFLTQANAEGLMNGLRQAGYTSTVIRTNETINGQTPWYRVIASSFETKDAAIQSRESLKATYPGAWLLYAK